jgi:hypothetical protein
MKQALARQLSSKNASSRFPPVKKITAGICRRLIVSDPVPRKIQAGQQSCAVVLTTTRYDAARIVGEHAVLSDPVEWAGRRRDRKRVSDRRGVGMQRSRQGEREASDERSV